MADNNVVSLRGALVTGVRYEPNLELVGMLEDWLDRAKSGELVGAAVAGLYADHTVGGQQCGIYSRSLVGVCFAITQRISNCIEEENAT